MGAYACLNPNAELYVIFLPFVALKAKAVVGVIACLEGVGGAGSYGAFEWVALGRGGWVEYKRKLERRKEKRIGRW